jgi:hypothetical protein
LHRGERATSLKDLALHLAKIPAPTTAQPKTKSALDFVHYEGSLLKFVQARPLVFTTTHIPNEAGSVVQEPPTETPSTTALAAAADVGAPLTFFDHESAEEESVVVGLGAGGLRTALKMVKERGDCGRAVEVLERLRDISVQQLLLFKEREEGRYVFDFLNPTHAQGGMQFRTLDWS